MRRLQAAGGPQPVGCLAGWADSEMVSGRTVQLLCFLRLIFITVDCRPPHPPAPPRNLTREILTKSLADQTEW